MRITKGEVGVKGRVTIPMRLRRKFNLKTGARITWIADDDLIYLVPERQGGARRNLRALERQLRIEA
ncbi:MAG: AbrB/MazE/SpoVT family DNA-binding domain-containing protein [Parcubacteria group bacterium]|nr:AbrB/MazE/SpoVT family DNA-binding domain-containing protein [Parcubacteria group bacterium]